jgi:hypothetical protein
LAKVAFNRERDLNRRYDFWTFADADVVLKCGEGDCLNKYNTFWQIYLPTHGLLP